VTIIAGTALVTNRKPNNQNNDYSIINFKAQSTGLFDEDNECDDKENDILLSKEMNNEVDLLDISEIRKKKKNEFKREAENPQDHAGFFSKITYSWMTHFMKSGTKITYTIEDVYPPRKGIFTKFPYLEIKF